MTLPRQAPCYVWRPTPQGHAAMKRTNRRQRRQRVQSHHSTSCRGYHPQARPRLPKGWVPSDGVATDPPNIQQSKTLLGYGGATALRAKGACTHIHSEAPAEHCCSTAPRLQGTIHPHTHGSFRNFELSLQSPLHPSITLLVRYRSHTCIQPYEGYTSLFKLHSQRALLVCHRGSRICQADRQSRSYSTGL